MEIVLTFKSLQSDQYQFSPNNIHTSSKGKFMRINKMIIKWKCVDLLSDSLNVFFKKCLEISVENLRVDIAA